MLAIGRLIEQKDHATLLAAFARLHEDQPDARLAILGWGRLESRDEGTRRGSRHRATRCSSPAASSRRPGSTRADVFAHTSRWEGFGIVLLEAMLAGLPIVATRVSAIPEIVVDGDTGILAEPGDAERSPRRSAGCSPIRSGAARSARPASGVHRRSSPSRG